jgi:NAD(P) transhydrogenase subunit alpha
MMRIATKCLILSLLVGAAAWAVASLAWAQPDDGGAKSTTTKSATGAKSESTEHSPADTSGASDEAVQAGDGDETSAEKAETSAYPTGSRRQGLMAGLTIFVLAVFVGFEVITKVPPTLHTPLMSGSNAISGITLVGAVIVAGAGLYFSAFIGLWAVALATVNVVGGFLVTHRMLAMFKKKK